MRMLAIETATEACSIALFDGDTLIARDHREIGRGHAEALVPMIAALPEKGQADRICVSLGPGSFTGVRIGIATARALGIAWGAEVWGYPTLALVAAQALIKANTHPLTVSMKGGHGEWFVQSFGADVLPKSEVQSLSPTDAVSQHQDPLVAGSTAEEFAKMAVKSTAALNLLPDAQSVVRLPSESFTRSLSPIYGRAPDAKPQTKLPAEKTRS